MKSCLEPFVTQNHEMTYSKTQHIHTNSKTAQQLRCIVKIRVDEGDTRRKYGRRERREECDGRDKEENEQLPPV